jgi:Fe-S cluster biogenesis protein NfuA
LHLHDGEVELVSVEDGTIRLRVHAKGHGCGSTSLRDAVEEAMHQAVPDLTAVMVDGADDKQGFVPLEMLRDGALSAAGKSGL